jgi:hypothetical protein
VSIWGVAALAMVEVRHGPKSGRRYNHRGRVAPSFVLLEAWPTCDLEFQPASQDIVLVKTQQQKTKHKLPQSH